MITKDFFHLLQMGELEKASQVLESLQIEGPHKERIRAHYRGQLYIYQNQMTEALLVLTEALERYGENIALQIDILNCYYHLGNSHLWRLSLLKVEKTLREVGALLSQGRRIHYTLWIGKHLEEDGQVAKALNLYRELNRLKNLSARQNLMIHVQLLRLSSLFHLMADLPMLYKTATSANDKELLPEDQAEWRMAVILAETQLFGKDLGLARLNSFLSDVSVNQRNKEFALADFVDATQATHQTIPETHFSVPIPEGTDPFEKLIFESYKKGTLAVATFETEAHKLGWANRLRLLIRVHNSTQDKALRSQLLSKFNFCLELLDRESRKLWQHLLKTSLLLEEQSILFSLRGKDILVQGQPLKTGPYDVVLLLLQLLNEKPAWETSEICEKIWRAPADALLLDRLRVTVRRLNVEVFEKTGIARLIAVTKSRVVLNSDQVKIEQAS